MVYIVGVEIGSFDYDFCENIDLSFVENYEPNFKKYYKSLKNYDDYEFTKMTDYSDINDCENEEIFYKLKHFIETYFETELSFYTEPLSEKLYDSEPLYLGVLTDSKNKKNIEEIKKDYDMETLNKILNLLELENHNELCVYKLKNYI
jgi:hypothetical protein